jgi:hypothetical protein
MPVSSAGFVDRSLSLGRLRVADLLALLPHWSVKDRGFGAVGDGEADDTVAIQAAATACGAAGGGTVYFPPGTYRVTAQISIPTGVHLAGERSASIVTAAGADPAAFPQQGVFYAAGSLVALPDLDDDVAAGDQTLEFASAPELESNDLVVIYDPADYSFNGARDYYRAGEMLVVDGVDGSSVTTDRATFDAYASADVDVYRMDPVKVGISDLTIIGIGTTTTIACVRLSFARDSRIVGCDLSGSQWTLVWLDRCHGCIVSDVHGFDNGTTGTTNYAVDLGNCQRTIVDRVVATVQRHAVTGGGRHEAGCVPNREIIVSKCILTSLRHTALDFHGNSEHYIVSDCILNGGISIGGDHSLVSGCRMTNDSTETRAVIWTENHGADHQMSDCDITQVRPLVAAVPVLADWGTNNQLSALITREGGSFRILDCRFFVTDAVRLLSLRNRTEDLSNISIEIRGCSFRRTADDGDANALVIIAGNDDTNSYWRDITFEGNTLDGLGFTTSTSGAQCPTVDRNIVRNAPGFGIYINETGEVADYPWDGHQHAVVTNNECYDCGQSGIAVLGWHLTNAHSRIEGNTCLRNGSNALASTSFRSQAYVARQAYALMTGNVWGDDAASPASIRLYAVSNVTTLVEGNNHRVGSITALEIADVTQRINRTSSTGHYEGHGNAIPTTGTWRVGDIIWNSEPGPNEPMGWRCRDATTPPGLWERMPGLNQNGLYITSGAGNRGYVFAQDASGHTALYSNKLDADTTNIFQVESGGTNVLIGQADANEEFNFLYGASNTNYFAFTAEGCITKRRTIPALSASGTLTQGSGGFTGEFNQVTTVSAADRVRTAPTASLGRVCYAVNRGANQMRFWPAVGDDLGNGVDTYTTLPAGNVVGYIALDATTYEVMLPSQPRRTTANYTWRSDGENMVANAGLQCDSAGNVTAGGYLQVGGTSGPTWSAGNGSPEGVLARPVGSTYSQLDGSTGTTDWRKETGGSTFNGWVAATAGSISALGQKIQAIDSAVGTTRYGTSGVMFTPLRPGVDDYVLGSYISPVSTTRELRLTYAMSTSNAGTVRLRLDTSQLALASSPDGALTLGTSFTITPGNDQNLHECGSAQNASLSFAVTAGRLVVLKIVRPASDTHTGNINIIDMRVI